MNEFNLLYPVGTEPAFHKLSETTCNDLSLDYILSYVAKSDYERNIMKGIMTAVESNPEVIRYRRDIFEDFMRFPSFKDGIRYSLDQLDYMKTLGRSFNDDAIAPLWQLVNRLQELDVYINCISDIHAALKNVDIRSEGLRKLRDHVASIYNDCGFEYLKADIKELITETSQIQSITLGINLDETMRPVEVGIMSINKKKFDHSNILDNFIGFLSQLGGLLFLLAQNGLYVPAEAVSLSPCDNIFTHFPADENKTVNLGRLGEESQRISEIFALSSAKSLLLFNESLASTSFTEGLYIARDVVKALRSLGARTVFNTHMHELAMNLEEINAKDGELMVSSLVTGLQEGKRSYKVCLAPPDGVSYARDIAEKYGVTYEQLMKSIH